MLLLPVLFLLDSAQGLHLAQRKGLSGRCRVELEINFEGEEKVCARWKNEEENRKNDTQMTINKVYPNCEKKGTSTWMVQESRAAARDSRPCKLTKRKWWPLGKKYVDVEMPKCGNRLSIYIPSPSKDGWCDLVGSHHRHKIGFFCGDLVQGNGEGKPANLDRPQCLMYWKKQCSPTPDTEEHKRVPAGCNKFCGNFADQNMQDMEKNKICKGYWFKQCDGGFGNHCYRFE